VSAAIQTLRIVDVRLDGGTQLRAKGTDPKLVAKYMRKWLDGETPAQPPVVFFDGEHYWLADGHHTTLGARRAGHEEIAFAVREGTRCDAVLYAAGANDDHGRGRTDRDRDHAVAALLLAPDCGGWEAEDSWLMKTAKVSLFRVQQVRERLARAGLVEGAALAPAMPAAPAPQPGQVTRSARRRDDYAEEMDEMARDLISTGTTESKRLGNRLQEIRTWLLTLPL
jgi:hypothetical protein